MLRTFAYWIAVTFITLTVVRCIFGARRILGIPYHKILWWLPTGSLVELAIHFYRTREVFDLFSYQSIRHSSPIVQLFLPSFSLTKPVILIADLREIQDLATKRVQDIDRSSLVHGFFRLFADHATIGMKTHDVVDAKSGDQTFKQQRRLWSCMVTPRMLEQVAGPALYRAVERMVKVWELKAQLAPSCAFQVDQDLRQAALEGMHEMLTGSALGVFESIEHSLRHSTPKHVSVNAKRSKVTFKANVQYPPLYNALHTIFVCLDWVTTGFSPQFYTWVFEYTSIMTSANRVKDSVLGTIISNARARIADRFNDASLPTMCVLDEVLRRDAESTSQVSSPVSDEALKDELMELLITGHETTAAAAGWALKYLADNSTIQDKLSQSLAEVFTFSDLQHQPSAQEIMRANLPYLDAVIAETLRLSATGPVSFRETIRDCQILGHDIKAGTQLILVTGGPCYNLSDNQKPVVAEKDRSPTSQAALQTRTNLKLNSHDINWSPLTFMPDRWIDSEGRFDQHAYPSLPFSAGPRGCFGRKIALLDLRMIIIMILLKFRLPKLVPELSRYDSRDSLTRKPVYCYVKPERRTYKMI